LINAIINYKLELLNMKLQTLYDFEKKEDITSALEPGSIR